MSTIAQPPARHTPTHSRQHALPCAHAALFVDKKGTHAFHKKKQFTEPHTIRDTLPTCSRERERERERERDGEKGREGGREGGREREKEREPRTGTETDRQTDRQTDRDRQTFFATPGATLSLSKHMNKKNEQQGKAHFPDLSQTQYPPPGRPTARIFVILCIPGTGPCSDCGGRCSTQGTACTRSCGGYARISAIHRIPCNIPSRALARL